MTENYYIYIGATVAIVLAIVVTFNGLVRLRNKVNEAFSTMDVYLAKRFNLIPELVACVKGYAAHETEALTRLTQERAAATGMQRIIQSETDISKAVNGMMAVVEAYPDLKANQSFLHLQKQLTVIEDDIASARRYYNGAVREYNNRCQVFPLNLLAGLFGFHKMPMFEASADERKVQQINLDS